MMEPDQGTFQTILEGFFTVWQKSAPQFTAYFQENYAKRVG